MISNFFGSHGHITPLIDRRARSCDFSIKVYLISAYWFDNFEKIIESLFWLKDHKLLHPVVREYIVDAVTFFPRVSDRLSILIFHDGIFETVCGLGSKMFVRCSHHVDVLISCEIFSETSRETSFDVNNHFLIFLLLMHFLDESFHFISP